MSTRDTLARRVGILPDYHQIDGTHRACGPDTQAALLHAMGLAADDESAAAASLAHLDEMTAQGLLPPEIVVEAGVESQHDLGPLTLTLETGETRQADPDAPGRLPPLPPGVHDLAGPDGPVRIIAAPRQASLPTGGGGARVWGIWTSLYGLRSARNLGLGDYEDLARAAEALAPYGPAFLGINPVHARGMAEGGVSPYSPSSRSGYATDHIALGQVPGVDAVPEAQALLAEAEARLDAARAAPLVDYEAIRPLHRAALRALFDAFPRVAPGALATFHAWRARRSQTQMREAVYEALSLEHGPDWRRWPDCLPDADSPDVAAFRARQADEIAFHAWCQWLAETQLANAQRRAQTAGMALGLYHDIAVGVRPGGAETWAEREIFATGASLGAPPDLLNAQGQNWDLAPFSPIGLRAARYAPFRRMLRATMRHAGLVRIDHIIGFQRSFWVPANGTPGGYVAFPDQVLIALTKIEAARAGCAVVGEDLGTVPDGLRETMAGAGLYGCAILPFERDGGGLRHPGAYRPMTLASFGSHDVPSLAGWWAAHDVETRLNLGHLSEQAAHDARWARGIDRAGLCRLLHEVELLPEGVDPQDPPGLLTPGLRDAIHALLARTASGLVSVALDDVFGVTDQQNVPGTIDEEPNWRRKAPITLEMLAAAPEMAATAEVMRSAR